MIYCKFSKSPSFDWCSDRKHAFRPFNIILSIKYLFLIALHVIPTGKHQLPAPSLISLYPVASDTLAVRTDVFWYRV